MSSLDSDAVRRVFDRAEARCEYCRMHQALQGATFHVEHIKPRSVGGTDSPDNLALACPSCNLGKSNKILVPDPESDREVSLFNPRLDRWEEHFEWGANRRILGLTATGRATIVALNLNHPRRLVIREAEEQFELFPPESA